MTIHIARVDHHHLLLVPFNVAPHFDRAAWRGAKVVVVGEDNRAIAVKTACAAGVVRLVLEELDRPAVKLEDEMADWDLGAECTLEVREGLTLMSPIGGRQQVVYDAVTPVRPGLHRLRVTARGRVGQWDVVTDDPVEEYSLTIWPVDHAEPGRLLGDDGIY